MGRPKKIQPESLQTETITPTQGKALSQSSVIPVDKERMSLLAETCAELIQLLEQIAPRAKRLGVQGNEIAMDCIARASKARKLLEN